MMIRIFIKILIFFVFALLPIQMMAEGKKVALVIGNANYTKDSGFLPLSNPLNDARAIADKLSSLGFAISGNKPLLDATKDQMDAAIEQFMYDSRDADIVLFYYSGHGASRDNKEALLLPLGKQFKEFNFRESCIGLETVVSAMNRYDTKGKSKFKIIILDACRNAPYSNPLDRSKDASDVNKGLVRTTPPDGFAFCYATAPGETAIERANERYSVYTEALLTELSSGKNFHNMMAAVSKRVIDKTHNRQAPKFECEYSGDFSFSLPNRNIQQREVPSVAPSDLKPTTTTFAISGSNHMFSVNEVTFTMIPVEGGTFTMGATQEVTSYLDDEKPTHQVTLSSFYIGETEVTQALWSSVMGNNPSSDKGYNNPVENVSWEDCQNFISKLNLITGKNFRLPTEAEWEFAARGGNKSKHTQYSGSKNIQDVAWTLADDVTHHKVKTKKANELGIYDMSGNVWEWCQDWDGPYSSNSQMNPKGPSIGTKRVHRGGGWGVFANGCTISHRYSSPPNGKSGHVGLRLVLSE